MSQPEKNIYEKKVVVEEPVTTTQKKEGILSHILPSHDKTTTQTPTHVPGIVDETTHKKEGLLSHILPSHDKTKSTTKETKLKVERSTEAEMSNVPGLSDKLTDTSALNSKKETTGVHVPPSTRGITSDSYPLPVGTTNSVTAPVITTSTESTTVHVPPTMTTNDKHLLSDTMKDIGKVGQDISSVGNTLKGIQQSATGQPLTTAAGFSQFVNEAKHNLTTHAQDLQKTSADIQKIGTDFNLARSQLQTGVTDIKEKFTGTKTDPITGTTIGQTTTTHIQQPPSSH